MLRYRDIDVDNLDEVACLVRWANDQSIRHLFLRFESEQAYSSPLSAQTAQSKLRESLHQGRRLHLLVLDEEIVGEVSLDLNAQALQRDAPDTAWFGLVIGEKKARGKGLGRDAMLHMEEVARELGATRGEIGVFEYNTRAKHLYQALGYREVAKNPAFTWWKGRQWTDIRMAKAL